MLQNTCWKYIIKHDKLKCKVKWNLDLIQLKKKLQYKTPVRNKISQFLFYYYNRITAYDEGIRK